jgi:hypothetical protein
MPDSISDNQLIKKGKAACPAALDDRAGMAEDGISGLVSSAAIYAAPIS